MPNDRAARGILSARVPRYRREPAAQPGLPGLHPFSCSYHIFLRVRIATATTATAHDVLSFAFRTAGSHRAPIPVAAPWSCLNHAATARSPRRRAPLALPGMPNMAFSRVFGASDGGPRVPPNLEGRRRLRRNPGEDAGVCAGRRIETNHLPPPLTRRPQHGDIGLARVASTPLGKPGQLAKVTGKMGWRVITPASPRPAQLLGSCSVRSIRH